jgi:hypothetical protein
MVRKLHAYMTEILLEKGVKWNKQTYEHPVRIGHVFYPNHTLQNGSPMRNDVTWKTRTISWFYSKGSSTVPEVVSFNQTHWRQRQQPFLQKSGAEVFPDSLHCRYIPNSIVHFPLLFFLWAHDSYLPRTTLQLYVRVDGSIHVKGGFSDINCVFVIFCVNIF